MKTFTTSRSWTSAIILLLLGALGLANDASGQSCVNAPSGLIAWWPGDGHAGDIAGMNDATLQGGTSFAPGKVGHSFTFDGIDDFVRVPASAELAVTTAYTLDAWVYSTGPINTYRPIFYRGDANGDDIEVYIQAVTNRLCFIVNRDTTGGTGGGACFAPPPLDTYFHLAVIADGLNQRVYYNGQPAAIVEGPTPLVTRNSNKPWLFGTLDINNPSAYPPGSLLFFKGQIDEIEIFNRALTVSEIQSIVGAGAAGKCKGPSYACAGFAPPFNQPLSLKAKVNRAISLQMQLSSDGIPITATNIAGAAPVVNVTYSAGGGAGVDVTNQLEPVGQSSDGNAFTYDSAAGQWVFRLGTRPYTAAGTYTVTVAAGDTNYVISPTCSGQFIRSP